MKIQSYQSVYNNIPIFKASVVRNKVFEDIENSLLEEDKGELHNCLEIIKSDKTIEEYRCLIEDGLYDFSGKYKGDDYYTPMFIDNNPLGVFKSAAKNAMVMGAYLDEMQKKHNLSIDMYNSYWEYMRATLEKDNVTK